MSSKEFEKVKKHICLGILAHVDAGKTTLSESMLYTSGSIRKMGRVDHKDAFLDTYDLERSRGITIFSKQAVFSWKDMRITLLDTPGHVDFSAEMDTAGSGLCSACDQWCRRSTGTYRDTVETSWTVQDPGVSFCE